MGYDKIYAEFRDELVAEYAQMRGCYMGEYQDNYDQNTSRKDDRIAEMNAAIQSQVDYIKELYDLKARKQNRQGTFNDNTCGKFVSRWVFSLWREYAQAKRRTKRIARATLRDNHQKKMQNIFDAWRKYSHENFKKGLAQKEVDFRAELESKILVQHQNKVDQLLLYAAELEDKIKLEQDAREKMTNLYDLSLSKGF